MPNLWSHKEGGHGHSVTAQERTPGGLLYLRYRNRETKNWTWAPLNHRDQTAAKEAAADAAHAIRMGRQAKATGRYTLGMIFGLYEGAVSGTKKGDGPKRDARRIELWEMVLGVDSDPLAVTPQRIKDFIRDRKAGKIKPPPIPEKPLGREYAKPSDTTAGNDVRFLSAVLSWAAGEGLLERNPIRDVVKPRNKNPKRPVATYDRYLRVRPHCTGLFGPFLDLVEALGWRVSALRQLRAADLDLSRRPEAPNGRILKREETDKQGVEMWVPLSGDARAALDEVLRLNPVAGERYLFPAPKAKGKPWGGHYVWEQLMKAEDAAGVPHLEKGAFHPYRRKWRRERKHLPDRDVAAAGGWLSVQTLAIYDGEDAETLLAVVTEPRKLREVK